jgi:ribosomal protein L37AE/L43A
VNSVSITNNLPYRFLYKNIINTKIGDLFLIIEEVKFVEQSHNKFIQIVKDFSKVCPKCNSKNIAVRRRKIPRYVCQNCGNEFDDPKTKMGLITLIQQRYYGRPYPNPDE